jgi:hypothetical protein
MRMMLLLVVGAMASAVHAQVRAFGVQRRLPGARGSGAGRAPRAEGCGWYCHVAALDDPLDERSPPHVPELLWLLSLAGSPPAAFRGGGGVSWAYRPGGGVRARGDGKGALPGAPLEHRDFSASVWATLVLLYVQAVIPTVCLVVVASQDDAKCEAATSCSECLPKKWCGWCSPGAVVYKNGTGGARCADQRDDSACFRPFASLLPIAEDRSGY